MTLFLAACGGGGGGGGTTSLSGGSPPTSSPAGGGLGSTSVERSDAQSALLGVQAYENAEGGGTGVLTVRRMFEHVDVKAILTHERRDVTCTPESGGGAIEETIVENSNGTDTVTIETFYDSACTQPEVDLVWTASASGYNITGPASYTQYNQNGSTSYTANAQVTFYYNSAQEPTGIALLLTGVSGSGAGSLISMGLACSETASGGCSLAAIDSAAGGENGGVADLAMSTSSVSMQVQAYQGGTGALSIGQGAFPDWTIAPASDETASVSISGAANANGGFTLTLTDNLNGGTFAITGSANGTVTGTLTATGGSTTDASFTIDSSGDGTLTYANGTQVSIEDYIVQS